MALSSATISYDIADLVGSDFDARRTKVWVSTNIDSGVIADTVGNQIRVGDGLGTIAEDGTGSVTVWVPGTGSNPASWQTYVHVDYAQRRPGGARERLTFGPFTVTGDANLADLIAEQAIPPTYLSEVTTALSVFVAEAESARDDAVSISGISTSDGVVEALVKGTAGAGPLTRSALSIATAAEIATSTKTAGEVWKTIAGWAGADAYIDFTTKPNGDPPSVLDTGQTVDYILQNVSNRKPQISGGKLVRGTLPASGAFANYYQAQCDGPVKAFGTRYTIDSTSGSTAGVMCLAVWSAIYEAGGTIVPRTPAHITINTLTNAWEWWVGDGLDSGSLRSVKQGTFTAPAKDGTTVWETHCLIDPDNGIGYLYLPGNDTTTGKRIVTLTNAEIATFMTAVGRSAVTFAQALATASVVMVEPFATTAANTAIYPAFLDMWGEVVRTPRDRGRTLRTAATSPAAKLVNTITTTPTARTQALTASAATITDGTTACTVIGTYGPTGAIEFEAEGQVVFTGAETVLGRMSGPTNTAYDPVSKLLGLGTGETQRAVPFKKTWKLTGGTPGAAGTWTLQMSAATSGGLASIVFGGSGAGYPPLVLKATPL